MTVFDLVPGQIAQLIQGSKCCPFEASQGLQVFDI